MKAFFHFTVPLLALITMVACAKLEVSENAQSSNNELLQELSITGKDFIFDDETRSAVTIGDGGASFTWDEDDVIGIFPDKGDQVSFAMDEGTGTQTATFSGGGWALKSSAKYAAYYPHVYENRDMTKIPVSYVGQIQNGNSNTDHIGTYDFMAAGVSTPENGAVAFDMQHLGALVQLTITVPEPSTLTKVVLSSSTKFTETGTIDLTADTPAITAVTQSNTFEIALNNVTTTEANENVIIYFMVAPIDLTESVLTTTIYFADETTCEKNIIGKNLQAGKAYRLSAEIEEEESPIQAVDLGLSVKWANYNVGADSPEKAGGYYSWGETEEKSNYDHSTYLWSNRDYMNWKMTKYCTDSEYGTIDNKTVLESEDDVANVKLGDGWRMPTIDEFLELFNNCSWEWTSMNGVNGYKISGNGNSIFLPAAGCRYYDETDVRYFSELGAYWSASLHDENSSTAWAFSFEETDFYEKDRVSRYPGVTIRPVKK